MITVAELVARVVADTTEFAAGMSEAEGRLATTSRVMTSTGMAMAKGLTFPLLAVAAESVHLATNFQSSMELIRTQAGASQKEVDAFSKSVLSLAGPVATAPETLSEGLYHLVSQGLQGQKAMDALRVAAEGAKVGQANLEDVTNALGATIVSGIKGSENYTQAMGMLNATVGAGDMHMQDLADAMGTGLPAKAAIFGVTLQDASAALAVFGDNNIRGAKAGTLLNSTIRVMAAPSHAAAKALDTVGISSTRLADDLRSSGGIVTAVEDLKSHMEAAGLTASQQGELLTQAFGGRQAGGVLILLDQLERLKTKEKEVGDGATGFGNSWTATTQTAKFQFDQMVASLEAMGITLGNIIMPAVTAVANGITYLASKFSDLSPNIQHMIVIFGGVVAAIGPVLVILGALLTPIGAVVIAIAALAAGFYELYTRSATVRAIVADVLAVFRDGLSPTAALTDILERLGLSASNSAKVISALKTAWTDTQHAVTAAIQAIQSIVKAMITTVEALWSQFGSQLTSVAKAVWNLIKNDIQTEINVIRDIIRAVLDAIHGNWGQAWSEIAKAAVDLLKGMASAIRIILTQLVPAVLGLALKVGEAILKGIGDGIAKLAGWLLGKLEAGISAACSAVAGWVVGVAEGIGKAIADGIVNGAGGLASSLAGKLKSGIQSAIDSAKHGFGIFSPSRVTASEIGTPLADGIIQGFLLGANDLPSKMSSSLRSALETAKNAVQSQQSAMNNAFQTLANRLFTAFDQATQVQLQKMQTEFQAQMKKLVDIPRQAALDAAQATADAANAAAQKVHDATEAMINNAKDGALKAAAALHDSQIAAIDATDKTLTPTEALIAKMQDEHQQAQLQQAIDQANDQLNQALAGGDASQVLSAQQALADATYQQTIFNLQKQADVERTAADAKAALDKTAADDAYQKQQDAINAKYAKQAQANDDLLKQKQDHIAAQLKADQDGINAAYDQLSTALTNQYNLQVLYYQTARDLQKQNLQEQLNNLQDFLAQHPQEWNKVLGPGGTVLTMFKNVIGPNFSVAGKNLGKAFANGLKSSLGEVADAAKQLADEVSKYLQLHSPAEKGPLSTLDRWWDAFTPTLLSGMDAAGLGDAVTAGLKVPAGAGSGAIALGGSSAGAGGATVHVEINNPTFLTGDARAAQQLADNLQPYIERIISIPAAG